MANNIADNLQLDTLKSGELGRDEPHGFVNGGWRFAREPNMEDAHYRIFDKSNPEHPDYEGNTDEDGDVQLELDLARQMMINQKLANLRPQDFIPFSPATRDSEGFSIPHLRTPAIRDMEMDHFKRFIKNSGTSTWDLTQRKSPMMIAKGKKKKNKELTIYDEAARRDAFRDMANEYYDPDTGRMGGGFDIMDDLLDEV
tara:strand:- start:76 stop:672 length:597 start_codon:yes stop_codon:yes gene_type:complete